LPGSSKQFLPLSCFSTLLNLLKTFQNKSKFFQGNITFSQIIALPKINSSFQDCAFQVDNVIEFSMDTAGNSSWGLATKWKKFLCWKRKEEQ
jgi:hypothetical protein